MEKDELWRELGDDRKSLWAGDWYVSDGSHIAGPFSGEEMFSNRRWEASFDDPNDLQICQKGYSRWYRFNEMEYLYRFYLVMDERSSELRQQIEREKDQLEGVARRAIPKTRDHQPTVQAETIVPRLAEARVKITPSKEANESRNLDRQSKSPRIAAEQKTKATTKSRAISESEQWFRRFGTLRIGRSEHSTGIVLRYFLTLGLSASDWYRYTVFKLGRHLDGTFWSVSSPVAYSFCVPFVSMWAGKKLVKLINACQPEKGNRWALSLAFGFPLVGMLYYQIILNRYWQDQLRKKK
jgi:hypothetical protein